MYRKEAPRRATVGKGEDNGQPLSGLENKRTGPIFQILQTQHPLNFKISNPILGTRYHLGLHSKHDECRTSLVLSGNPYMV